MKFSAIGDCVMAAPVATAIRNTHPDAFIAWAVESRCKDVVDTDRLCQLRFEIPRDEWRQKATSWREQLAFFARLRSYDFDYGLDLQGHSKTAICLRVARPKRRISVRATDPFARLLNPVAKRSRRDQHTVERNLEVLSTFGTFGPPTPPIMPSLAGAKSQLQAQLQQGRPLATVMLGTGHPRKNFGVQKWTRVADELIRAGYEVALLGGKDDPSPDVAGSINWVGKLTLQQTMAAVSMSQVHIAGDTGTGHIAAAYGVPVVSVFGYTDARLFRPYTERGVVLDAGKDMNAVGALEVVQTAVKLVESQRHAFLN